MGSRYRSQLSLSAATAFVGNGGAVAAAELLDVEVLGELALAVLLSPALALAKPVDSRLVVLDQLRRLVAELDVLLDPLEDLVDVELADLDRVRELIDPVAHASLPLVPVKALLLGVLLGLLAKLLMELLGALLEPIGASCSPCGGGREAPRPGPCGGDRWRGVARAPGAPDGCPRECSRFSPTYSSRLPVARERITCWTLSGSVTKLGRQTSSGS